MFNDDDDDTSTTHKTFGVLYSNIVIGVWMEQEGAWCKRMHNMSPNWCLCQCGILGVDLLMVRDVMRVMVMNATLCMGGKQYLGGAPQAPAGQELHIECMHIRTH